MVSTITVDEYAVTAMKVGYIVKHLKIGRRRGLRRRFSNF